jgi:hypothetical protein
VAFAPAISLPKQTTSVLALFFCHAKFLIYRKNIHWESNPDQYIRVVAFISVTSFLIQATLLFQAFHLLYLVPELQQPPSPGLKLRTIFQSSYLPKISSCSQFYIYVLNDNFWTERIRWQTGCRFYEWDDEIR